MFGIGGGEFVFIIFIILMFFGSDKIPEIARTVAKGIAQLKNATNDIKSEIQGSGIDVNSLTGGISDEISKAKEGFTKMVTESGEKMGAQSEIDLIRENFAKMSTDSGIAPPLTRNLPLTKPTMTTSTNEEIDTAETSEPDLTEGPIKRQR